MQINKRDIVGTWTNIKDSTWENGWICDAIKTILSFCDFSAVTKTLQDHLEWLELDNKDKKENSLLMKNIDVMLWLILTKESYLKELTWLIIKHDEKIEKLIELILRYDEDFIVDLKAAFPFDEEDFQEPCVDALRQEEETIEEQGLLDEKIITEDVEEWEIQKSWAFETKEEDLTKKMR